MWRPWTRLTFDGTPDVLMDGICAGTLTQADIEAFWTGEVVDPMQFSFSFMQPGTTSIISVSNADGVQLSAIFVTAEEGTDTIVWPWRQHGEFRLPLERFDQLLDDVAYEQ